MKSLLALLATLLALAGLGGCHMGLAAAVVGAGTANRPYRAGSLSAELGPGAVRTLGCLDVGFSIVLRVGGPILETRVGNRCVHSETLDLSRVTIEPSGIELSDPRREIVPLHVGGLEQGRERIRLHNLFGHERVCLGVGAIAPDAHEARPAAMCFQENGGTWSPEG